MRSSLFTRVSAGYAAVAIAALAVLGAATATVLVRVDRVRSQEELLAAARIAASIISPDAQPTTPAPTDYTVSLLDADGTVVTGSRTAPPLPTRPGGTADDERPNSGTARLPDGSGAFAFALVPLGSRAQEGTPRRFLYLTRALPSFNPGDMAVLAVVVGVAGALTAVLGYLVHRVLNWINTPIFAIQGAARRFAQGDLQVQLGIDGPPELLDLGQDLNLMAQQLRSRIAAISSQRNQLEAILSSMLEGVVVVDENRRIVTLNEAAGRLLHVAPGEAQGRTLLDYLRNVQLDEVAELALGGEHPVERAVTLYRERPLYLQVHATPLHVELDDRPTGTLLVMSDITRIKQLEDLRKDFVANVSHELKTPITSIKGFVETLLDGAYADPETAQRFLGIVLKQANRLHLIIEDLLSLSRLEQNDQQISVETFQPGDLLASALDICLPRAAEKSITIESSVAGAEAARGNTHLLEQALVNLVDNAVKYSPPASNVRIVMAADEKTFTMAVEDHGRGIRSQDLPRVFERFYRTDLARSREMGGTGLGLAIVKHIARAHHGEVAVRSVPGEGSTFTFVIPQKNEAARAPT
jgi:two-component system, OmpR family, phosphate regulon sensor histidine kinase PhoR